MGFEQLLIPQFTIIQTLELVFRLGVACMCGAAIGYERTKRLKEAGIRTHLIVCCASALLMIVSKYGFGDLATATGEAILGTKGADPARIAAQVISGVGFIGAGVIFHHDNNVKGLTTAAGLWATAGIGLTIGAGLYFLGVIATFVITVLQLILHKHSKVVDSISTVQLGITIRNSKEMRDEVMKHIKELNAEVIESKIKIEDNGNASYKMTLRMTHEITVDELNSIFDDNDDVLSVTCTMVNG